MMTGGLSSCSDFFDVESTHAAGEEQQWSSIEDTRAALMGVYALTRSALVDNNAHWLLGDLRLGDFTVLNRSDLQAIKDDNLNTNIKLVNEICDYTRFYTAINAAAVFIEKANQTVGKDQAYSERNLKWDVAQARALRAFLYFYMARLWGDVPLVTRSYDNGSFHSVKPAPQAEILEYAKNELLAATANLPLTYGDNNNLYYFQKPDYWYGILLNKLSAYALLAHISAYRGNYADAESYCDYIMDNYVSYSGMKENNYITATSDIVSSKGLFSSNSKDFARRRLLGFAFPYAGHESTREGHIEDLTLGAPYVKKAQPEIYVSRDSLEHIYTSVSDNRFGIDSTTVTYNNSYVDITGELPVFKKINVITDGSESETGYDVFSSALVFSRIEDILLLKAEAMAVLNRPEGSVQLLNKMRTVRGVPLATYNRTFGGDRLTVLNEVFNERRRELIGEGWRFYDEVRRQKLFRDNKTLLEKIENGTIYLPKTQQ